MKQNYASLLIIIVIGFFVFNKNIYAQDPNFHIYLCFGQSNMEGQGTIEQQDLNVNERFQVMEAVNCSNIERTKGSWYTAVPPLCRCYSGLSPSDYFGRTMVESLPDSIKIGIINVSVGGCKIELFDKDNYQDYVSTVTESWLLNIINEYNGNPYQHLVDLAKQAQVDGVIKGLLLHQGESNTGDSQWPSKVKKIYDDLLSDLDIDSNSIPLLAGEVVHADQGGICASMNNIIAKLPQTIPNSHIISSSGCSDKSDNLHFDSEGYRELGKRYAAKMISLLNPKDIPFVFDVENTGAEFEKPYMPSISELPMIEPLTDPFEWSDGSGRSLMYEDWSKRRAEIKAEIEHYEIGLKPDRPENITASFDGSELTVNVTVNGETLILTSIITLPSGTGPFPAIIGIGSGSGSLPSNVFSSRNIAQISFDFGQVMAHTQTRGSEPINKLYPELEYIGAYSAWSWGVSRIIDGLELVADDLLIDLKHLGITGCSFAGKMALFAGAFDERIALTIAQEPGGGGAASWRVSQTLGAVETLGSTSHAWFIEDMFSFAGRNVAKLPHDHHELVAMVAPRALLVLGNPDYKWLAEESGYVSCRAAHYVWKTFGITDRFGFSIVDEHTHCALHNSQIPEVEAFVDRFLLGDSAVNTTITTNEFPNVDYTRWTEWWGTGNPILPEKPSENSEVYFYEPECAIVGDNWNIVSNPRTSGGYYVTVNPEFESVVSASQDSSDHIKITFNVDSNSTFYVYGLMDCPTADDDSYWIKVDDESFTMQNGLVTSGWEWNRMSSYDLSAGEHVLTIAYRENGAKLDKICISEHSENPIGLGGPTVNACQPTDVENETNIPSKYELEQNYPNPFNPETTIGYSIPERSNVKLSITDILGREVEVLVDEEKSLGNYKSNWNASKYTSGIYMYKIQTEKYCETKKLLLLK